MTLPHRTQSPLATTRQHERAFTLIEILVVVVIVGILATLVAQNLGGATEQASLSATKNDISAIESAATRYRITKKRFPEEIQDLVGDEDATIRFLDEVPVDPWTGNEYRIERHGSRIIVYCDGADGEEGTEDDLSSENYKKMTLEQYLEIIKTTQGG